jgi:hypothetical protein
VGGAFFHALLTQQPIHSPVMDKSNIAFALITVLLGIYISVALLLSRVRETRMTKTGRCKRADPNHKKGSGPWTSFSS